MQDTRDSVNGSLRSDLVRRDGGTSTARFVAPMPGNLSDRLREFAHGSASQMYVAILAATAIHIRQHNGLDRFIVYSLPLGNSFAAPLPVEIDFEGLRSFQDVLQEMKRCLEQIPRTRREQFRSSGEAGAATLVSMDGLHTDLQTVSAELHIHYMRDRREWVYRYDSGLYRADTIACTARRIFDLLETGMAAPQSTLVKLCAIPPEELNLVLGKWNETEVAYPRDQSLQSLFEEPFLKYPDRAGYVCGGRSYSYGEVDGVTEKIASGLQARGLRPGGVVSLFVSRSFAAVAAMLGVLRAGGAYLPLDRSYPARRIAYLLRDAEPDLMVTERQLLVDLPQTTATVLCVEDLLESGLDRGTGIPSLNCPVAPAYLIYTSGSTGNPKGIVLDHRGRINNFLDFNRRFEIGPGDCILGVSSMSFDMSAYDVIGTCLAGSKLVLLSEDEHSAPSEWLDLMGREEVTIWHSVPSLMEALLDHAERYETARTIPPSLRLVLLGGDWIPVSMPDRIKRIWPLARVISLGGATEVSMDSTLYEITAAERNWKSIPYGRAMANQKAYVLDRSLALAPTGIAGELYLGGDGVGWGYYHQPRLSVAKFIPDEFTGRSGARLYATGDLARYHPDGQLELLGRLDFQVKIRGLRIELGEVEAALQDFPHVTRAVALIKDDDRYGKIIVAYVATTGDLDPESLRGHLAERLPYYAIPHQTIPLRELPLSPAGKLDRAALLNMEWAPAPEMPDTPITAEVRSVFAKLLNLDRVGANEDFFALGGHSLLALQLLARLEEAFGVKTPLIVVFESPTPAGLANYIEHHVNMGVEAPAISGG